MPSGFLYLLFFCSGVSGLVYQVIWVREFGNVFGNTVSSTSLVVAIFMLGLGAGSYGVGRWADRQYARGARVLLRAYGYAELAIAALGLAVALLLPRLGALTAALSSYGRAADGWYVLTPGSYVARAAIAVVMLAPSTVLMGGTLTLLIRHLVRHDVERASGRTIAFLYAVNTVGAAAGAFLTDFAFVPALGLFATEIVAVALNAVAGVGALAIAWRRQAVAEGPAPALKGRAKAGRRESAQVDHAIAGDASVTETSLALALTGFAAMGLEIVWLRHFTLLLGGYRSVFSLLLTVLLVGIGAGSLLGGALARRARPAQALMVVQALLAAAVLGGLAFTNVAVIRAEEVALQGLGTPASALTHSLRELWFNLRPMLLEVGLPALLMGCSYPLGNAVIQHLESAVGRRAGALYLANTAGAVLGSLVAGFVLLPDLGMQASVAWLAAAGAAAIVPLAFADRSTQRAQSTQRGDFSANSAASALIASAIAVAALVAWLVLPADFLLQRSLTQPVAGERVLEVSEGVGEIITVSEIPGRGRALITNGHPMSSTALLDQRYMRALAHIPLLMMDRPERVLVIGFGVGNTTDAARQHPSITRVDVADLSRHVLEHTSYFRDVNHAVLKDPHVSVFVNDGRQHLQMQPRGSYDLITLEPPPIAHAGVAALYSRDFYALARSRLKAGGFVSQWLPTYQVPADTTLAMVRAFVDVFPQAVLLSGTQAELILLGTTGPRLELDPERVAAALDGAPAVRTDLRRVDLGTLTEIVGTYVGSAATLARASEGYAPVTDDRPLQEYGVRSLVGAMVSGVPASLFDLADVRSWCPRCFAGDRPVPALSDLDVYLGLMEIAYKAPPGEVTAAAAARGEDRSVLGSGYLGAVLPDTSSVHALIGLAALRDGRPDAAVAELREALHLDPNSATANRNLGEALDAAGSPDALTYFRRAVELDPKDADAQHGLGSALLGLRDYAGAADHLKAAARIDPRSATTHNDLGVALASMGQLVDAIEEFSTAVALQPDFEEARRNLAAAESARRK